MYTEQVVRNRSGVEELENYCKMRKEQFICATLFIQRLTDIEKKDLI